MTPSEIPINLILLGLTLLCAAVFHHYTLRLALVGLVAIVFVIASMTPVETLTVRWLFFLSAPPEGPRVIDAAQANLQ
ncbi:MAG: hypothetical protein WBX14_03130 [Candidatus Udaeobacter sp.]